MDKNKICKKICNFKFFSLLLTLIIFFAFGFYHLGKFETVDEHQWIYERIPQYWKAIHHQEWKKTFINDKPGITLAYVSGLGLIQELHPEQYRTKIEKHVTGYSGPEITERLNFIFRLPLLLFVGFSAFFFFWILKKLTDNEWLALWTVVFIFLSPIILGLSQIINPDSLFWLFSAASFFSFLTYFKKRERKYVLLTTLFLGLSLASKYTGVIFFPFFFAIILWQNFFHFQHRETLKKEILKDIISYLLIISGSVLIFCALMPATILGKLYYEQKTILELLAQLKIISLSLVPLILFLLIDIFWLKGKLLAFVFQKFVFLKKIIPGLVFSLLLLIFTFTLINWTTEQSLVKLDHIPFDIKRDPDFVEKTTYWQKFTLELYPVVFSLSPLALLFTLFLWIKSLFKKTDYTNLIFFSSLFLLIYYVAVIANNLLATVRYSIVVYPLLFLLGAIGLHEFLKLPSLKKSDKRLVSLLLILFALISLWKVRPFYFNYTNFLLPKKYLISDAWGYGGYEAAQYLNALPDAENLTVWSDYSGTCEFFKGKCIKIYRLDEAKQEYKIDYYVLTRRGEIKYKPDRSRWRKEGRVAAYKYYERENPDWELLINGRPGNYIRVFKTNDLNFPVE